MHGVKDSISLKDSFIMGVIVQKQNLGRSTKTTNLGGYFIKFKLSDLQCYKRTLIEKIKNRNFEGKKKNNDFKEIYIGI